MLNMRKQKILTGTIMRGTTISTVVPMITHKSHVQCNACKQIWDDYPAEAEIEVHYAEKHSWILCPDCKQYSRMNLKDIKAHQGTKHCNFLMYRKKMLDSNYK